MPSLLSSIGIDIDRLSIFQFSLDAPAHLLPSRQELNEHVRLDIYRFYITATWVNPPVVYVHECHFMRHTFWRSQMGLLLGPAISHDVGLTPCGFL